MKFRAGLLTSVILVACFQQPIAWAAYDDEDDGVPVINGYEESSGRSASTSEPVGLKQRVRRLEQLIENQKQTNQSERIKELEQTIQTLQGKLDEQAHDIRILKEQQKNYYQDLDTRINNVKAKENKEEKIVTSLPKETSKEAKEIKEIKKEIKAKPVEERINEAIEDNRVRDNLVTPETTKKNSAEEEKSYLTAYQLIRNKQFDKALPLMQNFLKDYPDSHYAANAHYWVGEILLLNGDPDSAKIEFQTVINKFSNSTKVPDAHLKLGSIYADKGLIEKARTEFVKVQQRYPDTAAAKLATSRLQALSE